MEERVYFTYIVASRSRTLYIGVTSGLFVRVLQHKLKVYAGFSAAYNCNRLVWFQRFQIPTNAIAREKQLKGRLRKKKIVLIIKNEPNLGRPEPGMVSGRVAGG